MNKKKKKKYRQNNTKHPIGTIDDVLSFDELYRGGKKACHNVMWKASVSNYSLHLMAETFKLRKELLDDTYEISKYQVFTIHEPKVREITATRIRDRAFQRSLCDNIIVPAMTRSFIYDNGACLKGKGVDFAMDRMDTHLHRYFREHGSNIGHVLRCDIFHYFPETRHDVAKAAVAKRVHNPVARQFVFDIIDSFGGDKGIGLGSQVSQLIQLAVLDDLDHYIKEELHIKHYIRYMDDFVLIHEDKEYLKYCLSVIKQKLADIGLQLNKKTTIHKITDGINFLQWRYILTDSGKVLRKMNKSANKRERKRLRKLANKVKSEGMPLHMFDESFQCWNVCAKRGDSTGARHNMYKYYCTLRKEVDRYDQEPCTCQCSEQAGKRSHAALSGKAGCSPGIHCYDG